MNIYGRAKVKRGFISFIIIFGLTATCGISGMASAQAEVSPLTSTSFVGPISARPNFLPPVDGSSAPSNPVKEICSVVQYISGYIDVLEKVGKVVKWVKVAVYSSTIICSIVYR
jgi:hypothetical protein